MPTPNINIVNGQVTGTLALNQPFYWYNPNTNDVAITINDCGTWCVQSSYTIPAGQQYAQAQIQASPNDNPYAWTENPDAWIAGGGGPHLGPVGPGVGMPQVNIQNGAVAGSLQNGQAFNWYNPLPNAVAISNCGPWCGASSYTASPGLSPASMATRPNSSAWAFTESPNRWNTPGMPHVGNPPVPTPLPVGLPEDKEVA